MTTIIAPPSSNIMMDSSSSTTTVVPPSTEKRFLFCKRGEQQRRRKPTQSASPTRTTALLSEALTAITGGPHLASSMKQTTPTASLPSLKSILKSRCNNSNSNNTVDFAPHVNIQLISSIEDMTHEEKCNTWMQIEEHNAIRRSCLQLIESVVEKAGVENRDSDNNNDNGNGNGNDEKKKIVVEDLCTRGLESHLPQQNGQMTSANQNQLNRRKAIQQVVSISSKHCTNGYYDDQAIADVYHVTGKTQEFQLTAELMAIQDRQDVELYLLE